MKGWIFTLITLVNDCEIVLKTNNIKLIKRYFLRLIELCKVIIELEDNE